MKFFKTSLKNISYIRNIVRYYRNLFGQPVWNLDRSVINENTESGKIILFCIGGGSYTSGTFVESVLAQSIRLRGGIPHVLICDQVLPACFQTDIDWDRNEEKFAKNGPAYLMCQTCFRPAISMYKKIGCEVHKMSELFSINEKKEIEMLVKSLPLYQLKNFEYKSIPVGEHAYAGALRFYAKAELDDKFHEPILRRYLTAAILTLIVVENLSKKLKIKHAVIHHGIYVPQGVFAETFKKLNIKFTTWHVAYRKSSFIFSHQDTYHKTLMNESNLNWEGINWNSKLDKKIVDYLNSRWYGTNDWIHFHKNTIFDKKIFFKNLNFDTNKPYVLLLTNVMWDAQLHYPNNAFKNMLEWIMVTIEYFIKRSDIQLLIRVHPAEITGTLPSRQRVKNEILKKYPNLPNNIFIIDSDNSISTYVLAEDCNSVIIYGTKTGVELAARGVPVIVAGEAWIRNKGISIDVTSPKDYIDKLNELPFNTKLNDELIKRARMYAYHYFFRRMIPLPFLLNSKSIKPFDMSLISLKSLDEGNFRGLDIICNGILNGSEYIYEDEKINIL